MPIIMLHGWSFDHRHMASALEPCFRYRDRWRRIYLDMPGHGQTSSGAGIKSMDDVLAVLLRFLDDAIPRQRFVLAGMSAGGYLARGIIHHRRELVDGLLLFAPRVVAQDDQRVLPPQVTLVEDPQILAELSPEEAQAIKGAVVQSQYLIQKSREVFFPAWSLADWDMLQRLWKPEYWALSIDVDKLPEPFLAPTLIVTGRQDDIVGYQDAWSIIENYPRATFAVLDRAGHVLEVDQEALFHALVNEWLDRVEEYTS